MPKQMLMPLDEYEAEIKGARRKGRSEFARELTEDLWRYAFPGQDYNRNESLGTLWPKIITQIVDSLKQTSKDSRGNDGKT